MTQREHRVVKDLMETTQQIAVEARPELSWASALLPRTAHPTPTPGLCRDLTHGQSLTY